MVETGTYIVIEQLITGEFYYETSSTALAGVPFQFIFLLLLLFVSAYSFTSSFLKDNSENCFHAKGQTYIILLTGNNKKTEYLYHS